MVSRTVPVGSDGDSQGGDKALSKVLRMSAELSQGDTGDDYLDNFLIKLS
ncbi:hypothetical protein KB20921_25470 [Edwardsiella ictaluri]|nr:hypothetical protein KH20906_25290 [Edwardsiella ictaluri]BEI03286.1 hypothetical protein KB20921_25470 [Edwardsiella ictaluri]BEI06747.1 hypothetical protein KH201010_25330 [Edwardsiella ictaluri]BEI10212.1 hypothetical protein STU22726_25430 [Edwardsiella ictaluri]BEI13691.1 hypothetical protein STU22816_25440 [Edwardsiella ictaluri]